MKEETFNVEYQDRVYQFTRVVSGKRKLRQKIYYKGVEIKGADGHTYSKGEDGLMRANAIVAASRDIEKNPSKYNA